MLFREAVAVYSENHIFCGQSSKLLNVKASCAYSYHWALKGKNPLKQKKREREEKVKE
jgi:hypothetical protein